MISSTLGNIGVAPGSADGDPRVNAILANFELTEARTCFVIGYGAGQVTVYSQQVRALKLVWALKELNKGIAGHRIVVVGGGIAGVTAAAAAALFGARVRLIERGEELLHLQRGCHTRYLHPHIYDWPRGSARRAGAGLPILDWTVGTASEVATQLLADYHRIRLRLKTLSGGEPLQEICNVRDVKFDLDKRQIGWDGVEPDFERPDVIIFALGFGIEKTKERLPRRSYWRVDSLTQTGLDSEDDEYVVLVAGTGDGGVIDVLRAKLKEFDHGGFLDECVLRLESLTDTVQKIEEGANQQLERLQCEKKDDFEISCLLSRWLSESYSTVGGIATAVDEVLAQIRPKTQVIWIGPTPEPVNHRSQPLNRLLAWRLCKREDGVKYQQGEITSVAPLSQEPARGYRFRVGYKSSDVQGVAASSAERHVDVHQVVLRIGSKDAYAESFPSIASTFNEKRLLKQIRHPVRENLFDSTGQSIAQSFKARYDELEIYPPRTSWRDDISIRARIEKSYPVTPEGVRHYRIRIWLESEWALKNLSWVDYDLHPEYGAVRRRAVWLHSAGDEKQPFRHWVNTRDDFWIRVRCSDGSECGGWLSDALESPNDAGDPDLRTCICDLRREASNMRSTTHYRNRQWCDYVNKTM